MELQPKTETPLFLIWAILKSCPIKDSFEFNFETETDLLTLERTLRPLRCLSEAKAEKRTVGDLCILQSKSDVPSELDSIKGFSASEILEGFGGEEYVNYHCHDCHANVYQVGGTANRQSVAGCYGYLQSEYDGFQLFETWQSKIGFELYEVWAKESLDNNNTLSTQQMEKLRPLLENDGLYDFEHSDLQSLAAAIRTCRSSGVKLQVHVVPQSHIVNRNWIVPQHCSNCFETLGKWTGSCPRCRTQSPPISLRKRLLRGDRPYWPLVRFLGSNGTKQVAEQYFECFAKGE